MKSIQRVRVDSLHPWRDEYGNTPLSRDYDADANRAYVDQLARSMAAKGEPDEPISVVQDEDGYAILAGNSRVMAMRQLGTQECEAVVYDDADARAFAETAARTNTKKRYEPGEETRIAQQLLLFGSDEYVAEALGRPKKMIKRLRDLPIPAKQQSIEQLACADEIWRQYGEEAASEVLRAAPDQWEGVAARVRSNMQREQRAREIEEALERAGIPVLKTKPDDTAFLAYVLDPGGIPDDPRAECAVRSGLAGYQILRRIDPNEDRERDARIAEVARIKAERLEQVEHGRAARLKFVASRLMSGLPAYTALPHLAKAAIEDERYEHIPCLLGVGKSTLREMGLDLTAERLGALDLAQTFGRLEVGVNGIWTFGRESVEVVIPNASDYLILLDALMGDGYAPSDEEREMYEEAKTAIEESKEEK